MTDSSPSSRAALRPRAVAAALLGAALLLASTGCSALLDAAEKVHSETYDDRAAAADGWVGVSMPEWIPADAENIRTTATNNETNAVIAVDSETEPEGCEETDRRGLPFDDRYGGFDDAADLPDTVLACGPYEVVPTGSGWLGWFNATEEGQTPEDA